MCIVLHQGLIVKGLAQAGVEPATARSNFAVIRELLHELPARFHYQALPFMHYCTCFSFFKERFAFFVSREQCRSYQIVSFLSIVFFLLFLQIKRNSGSFPILAGSNLFGSHAEFRTVLVADRNGIFEPVASTRNRGVVLAVHAVLAVHFPFPFIALP